MATLTVADLSGVVYSSGKVFDGLSTGRLDTENFLRSGSLDGVASRADLALLEDLRDAAEAVAAPTTRHATPCTGRARGRPPTTTTPASARSADSQRTGRTGRTGPPSTRTGTKI